MRRSYRRRFLDVVILLLPAAGLALSGCAATQVKQVWRDESYPQRKLQNVLVIAAAEDPTVQREVESQFAKRFRERGIKVTEGFRVLPVDQLPAHGARELLIAKVRELGVDSVLVVQRDAGRAENEYIPGMTIESGFGYGGAAVIASTGPMAPTTQGYSHTNEFFGIQTRLFDAQTEKIIWLMRTQTRVDGPIQEQIRPYVSLVSRKLFDEKLFP